MGHERMRDEEPRERRSADRPAAVAIIRSDDLAAVAGWVSSVLAASALLMLLGNGW